MLDRLDRAEATLRKAQEAAGVGDREGLVSAFADMADEFFDIKQLTEDFVEGTSRESADTFGPAAPGSSDDGGMSYADPGSSDDGGMSYADPGQVGP